MYDASVWGLSHKTHLNKCTVIQKKLIPIIEGVSYRDHSEPDFNIFETLNFGNLHIYMGF